MSYEIRLSRSAVRDIDAALEYTFDQFGAGQYEAYKDLIQAALADIAADPNLPTARWRQELHRDARIFHIARRGKHARHYFVYRIVGKDMIDVSRMLHDAMDLQRHLPMGFAAGDE